MDNANARDLFNKNVRCVREAERCENEELASFAVKAGRRKGKRGVKGSSLRGMLTP